MTGSLLLAGGVVATAAWLGGTTPGDRPETAPDTPTPTPLDFTKLKVDPADLEDSRPRMALKSIEQFEMFQDDGKTITRLLGDQAVLRDEFVADIHGPRAEITFAPESVLTIAAAKGTFYYPGGEPRRGDFHHNTVVTLYEAPAGETADLESNRHVQMRLFLDETTHFDREQGLVRTEGPVRLVGRDVDFAGRGLSLTFNAGQQRIEQLVIDHGHQLRMAAGGAVTQDAAEPAATDADNTVDTPARARRIPPVAPTATPQDAPTPGQTYLVTLDGGVDVAVGANDTTLRGQTLRGTFVVQSNDDEEDDDQDTNLYVAPTAASPAIQATITADTPQPTTPQTTAAAPAQAPKPLNPNDPRALRLAQADDIVATWGGRLVLTPDPVTDATGGVGGTRLVLAGNATDPAQVITGEAQRLEAARVGYDDDTGRVWAHAEDPHSLDGPGITLVAPDVGRLVARGLELDRDAGLGVVTGPGQLSTQDQRLTVDFAQQLELSFATDSNSNPNSDDPNSAPNSAPRATDSPSGFAGIQQATFVGQVKAQASDDQGVQALTLQAHRLAIPFTRDAPDTDPRPAALIASADPDAPQSAVVAILPKTPSQPDTEFRANTLTVDLALAPAPDTPDASASASNPDAKSNLGGLEVARLRARGDVSVRLDDGDTHVTAHALDGDPRQKRLELFGQDGVLAVLERGAARLAGAHLILHQDQEAAEALGPGHFIAKTDPNDPNAQVRVAWTRSMTFDNRDGHAFFSGEVVSESNARESRNSLTAHELTIGFAPQDLNEDDTNKQSTPATTDALDIRRVHARADPQDSESLVNFTTQTLAERPSDKQLAERPSNKQLAERHSDKQLAERLQDAPQPDGSPLTAFTLISRELTFSNVTPDLTNRTAVDDHLALQTIAAPGRGRMLISDYRTPAPDSERAVSFAGAGLTAFDWKGHLHLDALRNDLRIEGDVIMAHLPLTEPGSPEETPIKLEAQVLTADLTETGGLGAIATGGEPAPAAQLRRVVATGAIRISRDQARVLADHLDYTTDRNTVVLTAEPGKLCELRQANEPGASTTARSLIWDLGTGIFSADSRGVGGGVVPIQ